MTWPDLVNGTFEFSGIFFVALNIVRTIRDKRVAGVAWLSVAFFSLWGYWNLFYYHHLGQIASWIAGMGVAVANTIWTALLIYYSRPRPTIIVSPLEGDQE